MTGIPLCQRMVAAERLLTDADSSMKEGLSPHGEVVEAGRYIRMLRAEHLLADRQRALQEWQRSRKVPLRSKQGGEDGARVRMLGAKRLLVDRERAFREWARPRKVAPIIKQ